MRGIRILVIGKKEGESLNLEGEGQEIKKKTPKLKLFLIRSRLSINHPIALNVLIGGKHFLFFFFTRKKYCNCAIHSYALTFSHVPSLY